jgi:hypothetical protein
VDISSKTLREATVVQRIIAKVRKALTAQEEQPLKKAESKLLLIIKFYGGRTMVLENQNFQHQRGRHFETEAVQLFRTSFGWPPQVTPSSSKPFTHDGVEWHIVILPLAEMLFNYIPEMEQAIEASGAKLIPIQEHPFYHRHLSRYE